MAFRFGDGFGGQFARVASVLSVSLGTIGMLAMVVYGAGQFLSLFLPFPPNVCAAGLLVIATLYSVISGFHGVVFTDIFQGVFILGATVYVAVAAFAIAPDMESLAQIAERVTGNASWTSSELPGSRQCRKNFRRTSI